MLLVREAGNTSNDKSAAGIIHLYRVGLNTFGHVHSAKEVPCITAQAT
ncbi:MAG: hypothetical protein WCL46_09860 [Chlorobium sp.]